ncbi:MAG TPA: MlaD family protein [Chthonomonas sp.]|jgi:phospholipid/cholesterol/gamma-HCH transport system substrate-binding protein|uniref:MlaD family protein n=1 Tax=Chthonomonas sp. TaxID=2282153 RepID=UPI002B4AF031|nr:MlaD family protein [Chthonomonas sp.]HLH79719.1 MlaD family protein [Chthonomonas sp.]
MESKSLVKVGLLTLIGLALGFLGLLYLSHTRTDVYLVTVYFDDTLGLAPQSIVRMQGVPIGDVKSISIDTHHVPFRPKVVLEIERKYSIPSNYRFVILSGILITTPQIEVVPPPEVQALAPPIPKDNTAVVQGAPPQSPLAALSPHFDETLQNLNGTLTAMQGHLGKLSDKLQLLITDTDRLVRTSNQTVASANRLIGDPRTQADLKQTVENFRIVSQQAAVTAQHVSRELEAFIQTGQVKFNALSDATTDLVTKLGNTIDDAREVVRKLTEQASSPQLQRSIQETVDLARSTLASVRQITGDIHQIAGDPELAAGIHQTIQNLSDTTAKADAAMQKVNDILDNLQGKAKKAKTIKLPQTSLRVDATRDFRPGYTRVDVNGFLNLGRHNVLNLGLYDLGGTNRLDLQLGQRLTDADLLRYGIYAGRLGVGFDYMSNNPFGLRFDLYDLNHTRLDAKALYRVNSDLWLWAGAEGIFRRTVPAVGIEWNR